jgi:hypothetical protein
MRETGITTETVKRFLVDAGAVYFNYGIAGTERKAGATRGGNSFVVEQDIKEVEMDGAKGPVKGARRVIESRARITANLIEMTADNFKKALAGADSAAYPDDLAKTHDSIRRTREITDADYIENIALVGNISGTNTPIILIIENALADGNLELSTEDKEEAGLEIQFTGHYDPADLDTEPWEIRFPTMAP